MTNDELYMQRCIELAKKGLGYTAPNPLVGSVVVHNNTIIGEGFHRKYGEAHAEANAIHSVAEKSLLAESTIYVNLEPCSHFGKTPPCADLIINSGIKKVVIGCVDPFAQVAGRGIARLRNHGCDVTVGVLKPQNLKLNKRFFTFHEKKRPYIILKWAQTTDGFIDTLRTPASGENALRISGNLALSLVHKWRSEESAIMVGTNTALADNPRLNVRYWTGPHPVRIVVDKNHTLPPNLRIFDKEHNTYVINESINHSEHNLNLVELPFIHEKIELNSLLEFLHQAEIQSVIIEGGQKLLQDFIQSGFWDEARILVSPAFLDKGVMAPNLPFENCTSTMIGIDRLVFCKNPANTYLL